MIFHFLKFIYLFILYIKPFSKPGQLNIHIKVMYLYKCYRLVPPAMQWLSTPAIEYAAELKVNVMRYYFISWK